MSIHNVKAICLFLFNLFVLNWAYSATRKCAQPMAVQKARGICEHFLEKKGFFCGLKAEKEEIMSFEDSKWNNQIQ